MPNDAKPLKACPDYETAWLIERGGTGTPLYWTGQSQGRWSGNSRDACRFSRREDAWKVSLWLSDPAHDVEHKVVEHAWGNPAPAQPEPDVIEAMCDAFMGKIVVDGNGGLEFLEEAMSAALAAMPARGRGEVLEEAAEVADALGQMAGYAVGNFSDDEILAAKWGAVRDACDDITDAIRALKSGGR